MKRCHIFLPYLLDFSPVITYSKFLKPVNSLDESVFSFWFKHRF